jgi:hypothetical protein
MAKSGKGRIVIWVIVGVLVIAAAVMLVSRPKDMTGVRDISEEDVPDYIGRYEHHLERLDKRVGKALEDYGHSEGFSEIDDKMQYMREGLADLEGLTEPEDIAAKMDSIDEAYKEARRILSDIKDFGE